MILKEWRRQTMWKTTSFSGFDGVLLDANRRFAWNEPTVDSKQTVGLLRFFLDYILKNWRFHRKKSRKNPEPAITLLPGDDKTHRQERRNTGERNGHQKSSERRQKNKRKTQLVLKNVYLFGSVRVLQ